MLHWLVETYTAMHRLVRWRGCGSALWLRLAVTLPTDVLPPRGRLACGPSKRSGS
jgi:hypothetical protein